jgi:hypothetical protein
LFDALLMCGDAAVQQTVRPAPAAHHQYCQCCSGKCRQRSPS